LANLGELLERVHHRRSCRFTELAAGLIRQGSADCMHHVRGLLVRQAHGLGRCGTDTCQAGYGKGYPLAQHIGAGLKDGRAGVFEQDGL
jgi:hypothetical protein